MPTTPDPYEVEEDNTTVQSAQSSKNPAEDSMDEELDESESRLSFIKRQINSIGSWDEVEKQIKG